MTLSKWIAVGGAVWCSMSLLATDLIIHLAGSGPISRTTVTFQCDAEGVKLGLPAQPFPVVYLNGAGNSLAVLPIAGRSLIFANLISGSGARYAADRYIWWDAGSRGVHLYADSPEGNKESSCQRVSANRPSGKE
jgi:membrane-bound inhibitor of C-type lysozyme